MVEGAVHPSFTDLDMLAGQIGVNLGGGLTGTRSVDLTRKYVVASTPASAAAVMPSTTLTPAEPPLTGRDAEPLGDAFAYGSRGHHVVMPRCV